MPKTNYQRGTAKEQRIVNNFKKLGYIALRSAGSHSPIDVVAISEKEKKIFLVQSKLGYISEKKKEEVNLNKKLNGTYEVIFYLDN